MQLIFDFDGTIINNTRWILEHIVSMADEFKFKKLNSDEAANLRHLTTREILSFLEIPLYRIPKIIVRVRRKMREDMIGLPPVDMLPDALRRLANARFTMGIITSNSGENVSRWLRHHRLNHLFKYINVDSKNWSKKYLLKRTLRAHKMNKAEVCFIGDETRDIEAANQCQLQSIAVTWGFNSEEALIKSNPQHIIRHPHDLLKLAGISF